MNTLRHYINLIEESETLSEINILKHETKDDWSLDAMMQTAYDLRKDNQRGRFFQIGTVQNLEIWTSDWPLKYRPYIFFLDNWGNLVGFCILEDVAAAQHPIKNINNVFYVKIIYLKKDFRKNGVGYAFYKFLLDKNIRILSDTDQTEASKALWSKLAKDNNYEVWTINGDKLIKKVTDTSEVYGKDLRLIARKI